MQNHQIQHRMQIQGREAPLSARQMVAPMFSVLILMILRLDVDAKEDLD